MMRSPLSYRSRPPMMFSRVVLPDGDELAVAEVQADLVKGCLDQVAGLVLLEDLFELKHGFCLSANTAEGRAKAAGTKISLYSIRKM